MNSRTVGLLIALVLGSWAHAGPALGADAPGAIPVRVGVGAGGEAVSGRLVLCLVGERSAYDDSRDPGSWPHLRDPQPLYATDVRGARAGDVLVLDDGASSFPCPVSSLPAGRYRARCVLDRHRIDSDWQREPGNLYSPIVRVEVDGRGVVHPEREIVLDRVVIPGEPVRGRGAEEFVIQSALLSRFRGERVALRALVIPPGGPAAGERAALYVVPGFGGDHRSSGARLIDRWDAGGFTPGEEALARSVYTIVLNPEGPNGHHLFADSANNGPVERALIEELLPALEARYPLLARPGARMITGHSSGGWSALWLTLRHPDVFGACWSSAPDPVDFRRFQQTNIYEDESMYVDASGAEVRSGRFAGAPGVSVRDENGMEEVLGPGGASAQAWDAWQAVFGPRGADGRVVPLYDAASGTIDREVGGAWRAYDIGAMLRQDISRYAPIFRQRVRLVVGSADTWYLNEAVVLLRDDLARLSPRVTMEVVPGYIRIVEGADHDGVKRSEAERRWAREMLDHLRRAGVAAG